MTATTTQTINLLDCPLCGEPINFTATYDVRLGDFDALGERTVTATLTMTGVHVNHDCPPISVVRPPANGGFIPPVLPTDNIVLRGVDKSHDV